MIRDEKIKMYKEKEAFVFELSKVFETRSRLTSVEEITYEVWENEEHGWFVEYVVITFVGGGQSHISVNGNSILAIFQEIAEHIMGGYYKEEFTYRDLEKDGFKKLN
ncbi:MAG: hypothetical protein J6A25_07705 [Lachnospiraceae bacterium]|nr:hypothetical protein [Lachnospiraceae bacterium]MBO5425383.1 hypothetical protein [Lachnospiraceae bacterium]